MRVSPKQRFIASMVAAGVIAVLGISNYDQYRNPVLPVLIFGFGMATGLFYAWRLARLEKPLKQKPVEKLKNTIGEKSKNTEVESAFTDINRHDELVGGLPDSFWSDEKRKNDEKLKR